MIFCCLTLQFSYLYIHAIVATLKCALIGQLLNHFQKLYSCLAMLMLVLWTMTPCGLACTASIFRAEEQRGSTDQRNTIYVLSSHTAVYHCQTVYKFFLCWDLEAVLYFVYILIIVILTMDSVEEVLLRQDNIQQPNSDFSWNLVETKP